MPISATVVPWYLIARIRSGKISGHDGRGYRHEVPQISLHRVGRALCTDGRWDLAYVPKRFQRDESGQVEVRFRRQRLARIADTAGFDPALCRNFGAWAAHGKVEIPGGFPHHS